MSNCRPVLLCAALSAVLATSACSKDNRIACERLSKDDCEKIVLPALKIELKGELVKYDLGKLYFTNFGCEKWSPLMPLAGQTVPEVHVVYDSCKHQVSINRGLVL